MASAPVTCPHLHVFNIPLSGPSSCDSPLLRLSQSCSVGSGGVFETVFLWVIWIFTLVFTSINQLSPARVIRRQTRPVEVSRRSSNLLILCFVTQFPTWLELRETHRSQFQYQLPKEHVQSRTQRLTWTDFINRWGEVNQFWIDLSQIDLSAISGDAALSIRAGCPSPTLLNESDCMTSH